MPATILQVLRRRIPSFEMQEIAFSKLRVNRHRLFFFSPVYRLADA
jgi:hypothetical protein